MRQNGLPVSQTLIQLEQLGLSNFSYEDVVKYFQICEEKGYIKPSVYQGHYNALARSDEKDLIPFLRKHNCVYNAYRYLCLPIS